MGMIPCRPAGLLRRPPCQGRGRRRRVHRDPQGQGSTRGQRRGRADGPPCLARTGAALGQGLIKHPRLLCLSLRETTVGASTGGWCRPTLRVPPCREPRKLLLPHSGGRVHSLRARAGIDDVLEPGRQPWRALVVIPGEALIRHVAAGDEHLLGGGDLEPPVVTCFSVDVGFRWLDQTSLWSSGLV